MKRILTQTLLLLATLSATAQDFKPCGTSILARRHQSKEAVSRPARALRKTLSTLSGGEKRGLIILVAFPDVPFSSNNPKQVWTAIANEKGYAEGEAIGSVSDYFNDQSYGQFQLKFDVVGPVVAAHECKYYGENVYWEALDDEFDRNVGELVAEACRAVTDSVSFADYDWDSDGEVEEVYILYAGHGENDYYDKNDSVIWPHMAKLCEDWEGFEEGLTLQGKLINTYACSNEISRSGSLAGMGTICHEFSHCLGLPDLYNTEEGGSVLGHYDVMDQGSYNGHFDSGWCPVGYSSYERYFCGWLEPREVGSLDEVGDLQPLHESPDACLLRLSPDANDYYLIENRQQQSWDTYIPRAGLLAWHIDYDEEAWRNNEVNNDAEHRRVEHLLPSNIPTAIRSVHSTSDRMAEVLFRLAPHVYIVRSSDGTVKKVFR